MGNLEKNFENELEEFFKSEVNDYSLSYEIGKIDDDGIIDVVTWRHGDGEKDIRDDTKNSTYWRWNEERKRLEMEFGEDTDVWEYVCFHDWQVKYFWMMASPYLFK